MNRQALRLSAAIALLGVFAGCESVIGLGGPKQLVDSGEGGGGATSSCPPPFPSPPDATHAGGTKEFTTAMHKINFGENHDIGLNLDRMCTCENGGGPSCRGGNANCDYAGGIDNKGADLLALFDSGLNGKYFDSVEQSQNIAHGSWSVLFDIRNYNGEPNDADVEFRWYVSHGLTGPNDTQIPRWDGTDKWSVSPISVIDGDVNKPKFFATSAYVANGYLVASTDVSEIELALSGGHVSFTLRRPSIKAKIVPDRRGGGYRLTEGVIAGVWKLEDAFSLMHSFRMSDGKPLCTDNKDLYTTAKNLFCSSADLPFLDGPPSVPCDAISFGVGFEADPAGLGAVSGPLVVTPGCPSATDPLNDSCDKM